MTLPSHVAAVYWLFFLLDICTRYSVNSIPCFKQKHCFLSHWKCRILCQILIISTKSYSIILFQRKPLLKVIVYLWNFMVNMLYQKQRAEISFDVSKVVNLTSVTKTVENYRKILKMQNCRHFWTKIQIKPRSRSLENRFYVSMIISSNQTLKRLAKALTRSWSGIYFQTLRCHWKWVTNELKERDIERRKTTCEILFDRFKRVIFESHHYWPWKVDLNFKLSNQKLSTRLQQRNRLVANEFH